MDNSEPGFSKKIRAPFLSSILSPLVAGSLLAARVRGDFEVMEFLLVLLAGVALHIATNVYNDIYDTLQGTDKVNVHRNEFSGGSGVLLDRPDLFRGMYRIARTSNVIALLAAAALTPLVRHPLLLWILVLTSLFFSKYYTAAPVKLAYRGLGELFVWLAFGPMAVLFAAVGQGLSFHPFILLAMPVTGISTLSILLIGQLIDLEADRAAGKLGVAARLGTAFTRWLYLGVQLLLMCNIILLALFPLGRGWPLLIALAPYLLLLPKVWKILYRRHDSPDELKSAARLNVQLHLLFSIALSAASLTVLLIGG